MKITENLPRKKRIVFCDFDGTITAIETFTGMLKTFSPELSGQIMPRLYERKLTLREGVRKMLESIPSSAYPDIIKYAEDKPIRPGLGELLDFLAGEDIPFIVVSGGVKGMVETVLDRHRLLEKVADIWAVDLNTEGEYFRVNSPQEDEQELVAKVKIMAQYSADETIAIGDSVTDINMALKADLVFARDRLIEYLKAENKPYIPWDTFYDVLEYWLSRTCGDQKSDLREGASIAPLH